MSFTVVFTGNPKQVEGNPMTLKSGFGEVEACGIGSAFEQNTILEEALLAIAEGNGPDADAAQKALDDAQELVLIELRHHSMKADAE